MPVVVPLVWALRWIFSIIVLVLLFYVKTFYAKIADKMDYGVSVNAAFACYNGIFFLISICE